MERKKLASLIGLVILTLLVVVFIYNRPKTDPIPSPSPTPAPSPTSNNTNNTVESAVIQTLSNTKPSPGLTRYKFEGDVKAINSKSGSTQVVLENGSNLSLPDFKVQADTRVWKNISGQFADASLSDLKVGSHVELHMDKDDNEGFWIFRDIYILK